jgi:hypothetical protein
MPRLFELVQIAYWLALSTWFGSVLFAVLAAPVVLRRVRQSNPILPTVLSVNLEGQHGTLLGGAIIGGMHDLLMRIQLIAAAVLLPALVAQWMLVDLSGLNVILPILRTALYVPAVLLVVYDWRYLWPKVWSYRQQYIDHADEPEVANPALDQFDRYQSESLSVLRNVLFLLLGMVLFSANVRAAVWGGMFGGGG